MVGDAARSDGRDGGEHGDDRERRGHTQYGSGAVGDRLGTVAAVESGTPAPRDARVATVPATMPTRSGAVARTATAITGAPAIPPPAPGRAAAPGALTTE